MNHTRHGNKTTSPHGHREERHLQNRDPRRLLRRQNIHHPEVSSPHFVTHRLLRTSMLTFVMVLCARQFYSQDDQPWVQADDWRRFQLKKATDAPGGRDGHGDVAAVGHSRIRKVPITRSSVLPRSRGLHPRLRHHEH